MYVIFILYCFLPGPLLVAPVSPFSPPPCPQVGWGGQETSAGFLLWSFTNLYKLKPLGKKENINWKGKAPGNKFRVPYLATMTLSEHQPILAAFPATANHLGMTEAKTLCAFENLQCHL